jgi:hypothetical protein
MQNLVQGVKLLADQAIRDGVRRHRELTNEEKAEIRTGNAIRNLMNTEGWHVYEKILQHHLQSKQNEFLQPASVEVDGISQILRSESAKGAIMGLRLALSICEGILSSDKALRLRLGLGTPGEDE